jgi:hypothetical protein
MNAYRNRLWKALRVLIPGVLVSLCSGALRAQLNVDCSGTNPNAYPTINAALQNVNNPGGVIFVTGTCNENVFLFAQNFLTLGAYTGQSAQINGNVSIVNSTSVLLYGLSVTNGFGDGIDVNSSRAVMLDSCASTGNAGVGLAVNGTSDVSINVTGSFDYNTRGGLNIGSNSMVSVFTWTGLNVDISGNAGPGFASQLSYLRSHHDCQQYVRTWIESRLWH